jgi:hypothetical protein
MFLFVLITLASAQPQCATSLYCSSTVDLAQLGNSCRTYCGTLNSRIELGSIPCACGSSVCSFPTKCTCVYSSVPSCLIPAYDACLAPAISLQECTNQAHGLSFTYSQSGNYSNCTISSCLYLSTTRKITLQPTMQPSSSPTNMPISFTLTPTSAQVGEMFLLVPKPVYLIGLGLCFY